MHRRTAVLAAVALTAGLVPATLAVADSGPDPAIYLVGGAVESINPTPAMLAGNDFFLGGYGFGSGRVANEVDVPGVSAALGDRYATGVLGDKSWPATPSPEDGTYESDGVHSRAFAVSDRKSTIVLSQIETQGYFSAYRQGPFGENEIRRDASAEIARLAARVRAGDPHPRHGKDHVPPPVPSASQIVVDSDHSHGGPDTVGVWGGVPTSYLKLVHDRTVQAIVDAWKNMREATLTYGVAHAGVNGEAQYPPSDLKNHPDWILNNQFAYDNGSVAGQQVASGYQSNQTMDDEIRVLQARDPVTHEVLDTYTNYSSHPTVLGSDNREVTADYVGRLDVQLERAYGGFAMDQVATLGREQPARQSCTETSLQSLPEAQKSDANPAWALCELDEYAARVKRKVDEALATAKPLSGTPLVAMNSYLLADPTTSGVLAGIVYAGQVIGAPVGRAPNAPWYTGTVIGTPYFVGRIGPVLITGGPGEMYAQIWQKVKNVLDTNDGKYGITSVMDIGTAGDFLGYIIAPLEAYPEPARRSMFDGSPPPDGNSCSGVQSPVGCPSPVDNDNYFFNVSHTFGERLTCDFLRGAGDIVENDPSVFWQDYDRCPAFVNDYVTPPGADTRFPEQPDLSAVLTHM